MIPNFCKICLRRVESPGICASCHSIAGVRMAVEETLSFANGPKADWDLPTQGGFHFVANLKASVGEAAPLWHAVINPDQSKPPGRTEEGGTISHFVAKRPEKPKPSPWKVGDRVRIKKDLGWKDHVTLGVVGILTAGEDHGVWRMESGSLALFVREEEIETFVEWTEETKSHSPWRVGDRARIKKDAKWGNRDHMAAGFVGILLEISSTGIWRIESGAHTCFVYEKDIEPIEKVPECCPQGEYGCEHFPAKQPFWKPGDLAVWKGEHVPLQSDVVRLVELAGSKGFWRISCLLTDGTEHRFLVHESFLDPAEEPQWKVGDIAAKWALIQKNGMLSSQEGGRFFAFEHNLEKHPYLVPWKAGDHARLRDSDVYVVLVRQEDTRARWLVHTEKEEFWVLESDLRS